MVHRIFCLFKFYWLSGNVLYKYGEEKPEPNRKDRKDMKSSSVTHRDSKRKRMPDRERMIKDVWEHIIRLK